MRGNMIRPIKDHKDRFTFPLLAALTKFVLGLFFRQIIVKGRENLPKSGPFICIANHSSRFDGPTLGCILDRPANFMVSPYELKGLQGWLLGKVGSFSSDPRQDFVSHIKARTAKGEPFVIFPEGTTYYDGYTHPFKKGVAKLALQAYSAGINLPVVPVAIDYDFKKPRQARFNIGQPVDITEYGKALTPATKDAVTASLLSALEREVLSLRAELGCTADAQKLLASREALGPVNLPVGNQLIEDRALLFG